MPTTESNPLSVDEKIDDLYQITETIDGRVMGLARQVDRRFDTVDDRLGRMESDITGLKTDITGLKTDITGLKTDITGLKTDMATVLQLLRDRQ